MTWGTDVRHVLSAIRVPTLILHRQGDQVIPLKHARYLAEHIPNARLVGLPGDDHLVWVGDAEAVLAEVEEFLTGTRPPPEPDRVLATVLFTDLVDSTAKAAALGDRRWRHPLYARVDGVLRDGRFLLMEVEVNEPGLGLHLAPGAAERFATTLLARLPS
jgi:hypothetical protein